MVKAMILLGAPGSGKGTIAGKIGREFALVHVSTGDMLREAVKSGTGMGRKAEGYMKRGELVPDSVIASLVEDRLAAGDSDASCLFDGFPRTVAQAELLEETLARRGGGIAHVFFLDAPRDVLIQRLAGRRTCRKCGANYHVVNIPPKKDGVCDICGGKLYQRPDDCRATIENRLDVYSKQTESLISRYEQRGLLVRINSSRKADEIASEIEGVLFSSAIGAAAVSSENDYHKE